MPKKMIPERKAQRKRPKVPRRIPGIIPQSLENLWRKAAQAEHGRGKRIIEDQFNRMDKIGVLNK